MTLLRRFWFRFENSGKPSPLNLGCGVTAYDRDDAMLILIDKIFRENPMPRIETVIEDVDVSTLDQKHVLPNMGAPNQRGVWYPMGYT